MTDRNGSKVSWVWMAGLLLSVVLLLIGWVGKSLADDVRANRQINSAQDVRIEAMRVQAENDRDLLRTLIAKLDRLLDRGAP